MADHRGFFIFLDYGKLVEKFWGWFLLSGQYSYGFGSFRDI